jgi:hypothetical protein
LSVMGASGHRRHGVHGTRDGAGSTRRDGRRREGDGRVPRVALALTLSFFAFGCDLRHRSAHATVIVPLKAPDENFTAFDSPSLQFLPRQQEAPGWRLAQDPIVVPGDRLVTYLDRDAANFTRYSVIDMTSGNYVAANGNGFATVQIYRFPDFVKAFGAYSQHKNANAQYTTLANEAFLLKHSLHMWRGPFYIRVTGGSVDGSQSLLRLAQFIADRMPAAPAKPAVFNFLPPNWRVPNSERYSAASGFGQPFLGNSFQASFNVDGTLADGLIIPAGTPQQAAAILNAYRNLYVRNGKLMDPIPNLGEDNFTGEDRYLGRCIAFRLDRFVVAFNSYGDRQKITDLASTTDQRILGTIRKQLVSADKEADTPSRSNASANTPPWARPR